MPLPPTLRVTDLDESTLKALTCVVTEPYVHDAISGKAEASVSSLTDLCRIK